ncbi:hypothetical protein ACTQ56_01455 [[Clostridium] aminophilum]|uniref:hypothetical protein n=1 Tax=[Clostridium] aminophilum TaxID=1526 RepID=UPI0026F092DE|nr:hypothetical protein [[Clostridium] aminophilum]MDD6195707.1 hypothetical protein [[Clostridium] aminophilum]
MIQSNPGVLTVIRIANSTLDYLVKTINYGGIVSDYQFTDTTFQHGLYETNQGQTIENP